ncbi:MAG: DUF6364 family protein [Flavobacteriales bacterium]
MATVKGRKAKSKLTLTMAPEYLAMLRRASARRGRSVSELVEELAMELDKESEMNEEFSDYLKRNLGVLDGKVKPEEWDRDDRIGDILRKHVPRGPRSA